MNLVKIMLVLSVTLLLREKVTGGNVGDNAFM